jgi:hypothetical protein
MEALFKEVNYKPASLKQQFAVELSLTYQLEIVKPILNFNIIFTYKNQKVNL